MAGLKGHKATAGVQIKEDQYVVKLFSLVHIGLQASDFGVKNQVIATVELQDTKMSEKDARPLVSSVFINADSVDPRSALYKYALAFLGGSTEAVTFIKTKGSEDVGALLEKMLGKAAQANFVANEKGKVGLHQDQIAPIGLLKSTVTPIVNPIVSLLDADAITAEQLGKLPEFVQKAIQKRVKENDAGEFTTGGLDTTAFSDTSGEDNIPF